MHRLKQLWTKIVTSFWLVPTLMVVASIVLAVATGLLDVWLIGRWPESLEPLFATTVTSARSLLDTIAGSMITVAGVVFSMTMVALANASANYGPRLLESFHNDRGSQVTLGTFLATFIYGLLVQRLIVPETATTQIFVPRIGLVVAVFLALTGVGMLIYFVHHIVQLLSVAKLSARVGRRLREHIQASFPHTHADSDSDCDDDDAPWRVEDCREDLERWPEHVTAAHSGYLQDIDRDRLVALARRTTMRVALHVRPGEFVIRGMRVASLQPSAPGVVPDVDGDDLERQVRAALSLGSQRLTVHDVELLIEQLVEVAERALSPGVNDTLVACTSMDWLAEGLRELSLRRVECRHGGDTRHVLEPLRSFADFCRISFGALRPDLRRNRDAALHAIELLRKLALTAPLARDRSALLDEIEALSRGLDTPEDDTAMVTESCQLAVADIARRHGEQRPQADAPHAHAHAHPRARRAAADDDQSRPAAP